VLKRQTYPGLKDHEAHFYVLLEAFADSRYLTVDRKPIFVIHRPRELPDSRKVTDFWRDLAVHAGLKGLYLVAAFQPWEFAGWSPQDHGFDAIVVSGQSNILAQPPKTMLGHVRRSLLNYPRIAAFYRDNLRRPLRVYKYKDALPYFLLNGETPWEYFPCVVPNWDNTPRSGLDGLVLHGSTPELFRIQLRDALKRVATRSSDHRIVFVKSWNEWAEGNYLEPDQRFGKAYLQVIKEEVHCDSLMHADHFSREM
jgi:hypothetical protein